MRFSTPILCALWCIVGLLIGAGLMAGRVQTVARPDIVEVVAPDGTIIRSPAAMGLTLSDTGSQSIASNASSRGADITARGDSALLETAETAPTLNLPTFLSRAGASIGGSSLNVLSKIETKPIVLYVIGSLFLVAGIGVWYFTRDIKGAACCAAAGVCILGVAYYPWLLLVAIGLAAVAAIFIALRGGQFRKGLQTVVQAVHADPVLEEQVKTAINQNAGTAGADKIKPIVSALKA